MTLMQKLLPTDYVTNANNCIWNSDSLMNVMISLCTALPCHSVYNSMNKYPITVITRDFFTDYEVFHKIEKLVLDFYIYLCDKECCGIVHLNPRMIHGSLHEATLLTLFKFLVVGFSLHTHVVARLIQICLKYHSWNTARVC